MEKITKSNLKQLGELLIKASQMEDVDENSITVKIPKENYNLNMAIGEIDDLRQRMASFEDPMYPGKMEQTRKSIDEALYILENVNEQLKGQNNGR